MEEVSNGKKKKEEKNFGELIKMYRRLGYNTSESISKAYSQMYKLEEPDSKNKKKEKKNAVSKRSKSKKQERFFGEYKAGNGSWQATETSSCDSL